MRFLAFASIVLLFFLSSCNTLKHSFHSVQTENWETVSLPNDVSLTQTIFAVGELGRSDIHWNPLIPLLKEDMLSCGKKSSFINLGSHLYPKGLASKDNSRRKQQERQLDGIVDLLDDYEGRFFFLSGEHDWDYRGDKGLKGVKRLEDYLEKELPGKDFFLPEDGCGDPYRFKIDDDNKDIVYLFINTQWWLEDWDHEKNINKGCEVKSRTEFVDRLREIINQNKNKNLFVFMHHPLYSNGVHGGNIPAKYHLFPATEKKKRAYIPLPGIGSLAALHRKIGGHRQDLNHLNYERLKSEIELLLFRKKDVIFVSAHDYAMQYFKQIDNHFVVSGSAGGKGYARKGGMAQFVSARSGYTKFYVYENGAVWMEVIAYSKEKEHLEVIFRQQLKTGDSKTEEVLEEVELIQEWPEKMTLAGGLVYSAKKAKRFWLGDLYRTEWTIPVDSRVVDITKERGGLNPLRKGGGMASNSLRLEDTLGHQYVFRSVFKSAEKTTPVFARNTWAQSLLQDMLAGSHPYAALVVPALSRATNVYYAQPELIYVPKQEGLGFYNESFGNEMYLYEPRPAGDRRDLASFGHSKDIIGVNDLLPKIQQNTDHVVDQKWVLKSRLLDIWMHDWDRHDDQWRWASFKKKDETIYRPIPRDRDQVFWKFDGPFPGLISALGIKKFKSFGDDIKKVGNQSFNARYFDRYFLTAMERQDFIDAAEKMQEDLTDEVIENAFDVLDKDICNVSCDHIITTLKKRRENLVGMAERWYEFISKEVNVIGTEEADKFKIKRNKDGSTEVKVYALSKKGKKKDKYFDRTFLKGETKEIRLYGLGDDDEFELDGKAKKGIKIRIIAGSGKDIIDDRSKVAGLRKLTKLYDVKDDFKLKRTTKETHNKTSKDYDVNDYNREEFLYNSFMPLLNVGSTFDDRFFIGAGLISTLQGFRSDPYKTKHNLSFLKSTATRAFMFKYSLDRIGTFDRLNSDFTFDVDLSSPVIVNYFGLGNDSKSFQNRNRRFNWVRLEAYKVAIGMKKTMQENRYTFRWGGHFNSFEIEDFDGRIVSSDEIEVNEKEEETKNYFGGYFNAVINTTKNPAKPMNGVLIDFSSAYNNLIASSDHFGQFQGSMAYYVTFFKKLPTTFATRVGAAANVGEFPFYLANTLGEDNFLRGYRRQRFAGTYSVFQNVDLRVRLVNWKNSILPMEVGILGGFDYGRVWENKEEVNTIHKSYTTGLWLTPFTIVSVNFNYTFTKETDLFSFGLGFFF